MNVTVRGSPVVTISLTMLQADALSFICKMHYDSKCRQLAGRFDDEMNYTKDSKGIDPIDPNEPICHVRLSWGQIDTLAKAMEQMPWSVSAKDRDVMDAYQDVMDAYQDVMDAYATLRTPLLNTLRHVRDLSAQWYHVLNHIPMTPVVVGPNKTPRFSHRG